MDLGLLQKLHCICQTFLHRDKAELLARWSSTLFFFSMTIALEMPSNINFKPSLQSSFNKWEDGGNRPAITVEFKKKSIEAHPLLLPGASTNRQCCKGKMAAGRQFLFVASAPCDWLVGGKKGGWANTLRYTACLLVRRECVWRQFWMFVLESRQKFKRQYLGN